MSHHDDLLTSAETAALLSIKPNTLEVWRNKGKGPAFVKMGDTRQAPIRYHRSVVAQWIAERSFASTSAYGAAALANFKAQRSRSVGASA
jgi:hypothetical protein